MAASRVSHDEVHDRRAIGPCEGGRTVIVGRKTPMPTVAVVFPIDAMIVLGDAELKDTAAYPEELVQAPVLVHISTTWAPE